MTRQEKVNLLNELLGIEEKNDIGNLTSTDRREFQQWVEELEQEPTTKNDLGVDCISRQDALMCLTGKFEIREYEPSELISIFLKRIKALPSVTPQEPFINKPCVSSEVCEHDKQKILDKIRAEMLEEMISHSGTGEEVIQAYADGLKKGLEILDKYKAESEGKQ